MILQLDLDDKSMAYMTALTGMQALELTSEALTLLHWAISEAARGRVIISTNQDGGAVTKLTTPAIKEASQHA